MEHPVSTHERRALAFYQDAINAQNPDDCDRYLAAAVENAIGVVESMIHETGKRDQVIDLAKRMLPRYGLLKRVRIHNFHRRPLPHMDSSGHHLTYTQGPITLTTGEEIDSFSAIRLTPSGLDSETVGGGKVDFKGGETERELTIVDGRLKDPAGDEVALTTALEEFLANVPRFVEAARRDEPFN